jgi:hypothetical protein
MKSNGTSKSNGTISGCEVTTLAHKSARKGASIASIDFVEMKYSPFDHSVKSRSLKRQFLARLPHTLLASA